MSSTLSFNLKEFERNLSKMRGLLRGNTARILRTAANEIITESKKQVPTETGTLRSTAFAEVIAIGDTAAARIGYSGNALNPRSKVLAEEYMVKIHEDTSLNHPNGGKAKFLEDPLNDFQAELEENLSRIAKGILRL